MAKKPKKAIYVEKNGESHLCEWYKKGKKRVLVDTETMEVVAHNPLPLLALGVAAYKGYKAVKSTGILDKKEKPKEEKNTTPSNVQIIDNLDKPNRKVSDIWAEKIYTGRM